jgi:nucleotide-binding universal stress UspA family protein
VILVATDGSKQADAALRLGLEVAGPDEPVLCLTVWRELRGDFGLPYLELLEPSASEIEREWAQQVASEAAATAAASGRPAEAVVRRGNPAEEICELARERGARVVVLGSHGWGPIEGTLLGSALRGVLRRAPCPVLVAPPDSH